MIDPPRTSLLALLLVLLAACGGGGAPEEDLAGQAEAAWAVFQEHPSDETYQAFRNANRTAARYHENPHDAEGVLYQVRGIEAEADQAVRMTDLNQATGVAERVEELESGGLMDLYEEMLPGARERLEAARTRVLPLITR